MNRSVAIIDSGAANVGSVVYALERLGYRPSVTRSAHVIATASRVIFPGVGAAGVAMRRLRERELDGLLPTLTQPVLGVCLGMQLLFCDTEEDATQCLGIIPGQVRRIPSAPGLRVPHMGWAPLTPSTDNILTSDIHPGSYAYFVHSFAAPPARETVSLCHHGIDFSAVVAQDNFYGTQFHPERSAKVGSLILRNFMEKT